MELRVFIHGKPQSIDSTGIYDLKGPEEKITDSFFRLSNVKYADFLVVQILRHNNVLYSASTYYHDGRDSGGRSNGYFAITIVSDGGFYPDISTLYEFLGNQIYKQKVCGDFGIIDSNAKYKIDSFSYKQQELSDIADQIKTTVAGMPRHGIDKSFCSFSTLAGLDYINPAECNSGIVMNRLREEGIIAISEHQITEDEMINQKLKDEVSKKTEEINRLNMSISQILKEKDSIKIENEKLKSENEKLRLEVESNKGLQGKRKADQQSDEKNRQQEESTSTLLHGFRPADFIIIGVVVVFGLISTFNGCSNKSIAQPQDIAEEQPMAPQSEQTVKSRIPEHSVSETVTKEDPDISEKEDNYFTLPPSESSKNEIQ